MTIRSVAKCASFCFLWAVQAFGAEQPRLANEKVLFERGARVHRGFTYMLLGCNGQKLLYVEKGKVQVPTKDGRGTKLGHVDKLAVLDVATGAKKLLPLPALPSGDPMELDNWLRSDVLSPDGRQVLLPGGIDANKDGIFDYRREKRQIVLYDLKTGEMKPVAESEGGFVWPLFSRSGKEIIVLTADPKDWSTEIRIKFVDQKVPGRKLAMDAFPMAICPSADLAAILRSIGKPPNEPYLEQEMALYDLKADKQVTKLPTDFRHAQTPVHAGRWTANGRYLYYTDVRYREEDEDRELPHRRTITRVWDRILGKQIAEVDNALPLGHGPTETAMLLELKIPRQEHGLGMAVLHDASRVEDGWLSLQRSFVGVICTDGKRVVYSRLTGGPNGPGWVVCVAEIVMPRGKRAPLPHKNEQQQDMRDTEPKAK